MYIIVKKVGKAEVFVCHLDGESKQEVLIDLKNAVSWAEFQDDGTMIIAGDVYCLREVEPASKAELQTLFGTAEPALVA